MPLNRTSEDRREGVRVDDRVLLEYWPVMDEGRKAETSRRFAQIPLPVSPETGDPQRLDPLVVQWMSKIEWTLDAILHTLEHPGLFISQVELHVVPQGCFELWAVRHCDMVVESQLAGCLASGKLPVADPVLDDQHGGGLRDQFTFVRHANSWPAAYCTRSS